MKIGEVATQSGFSASAIRYYESVDVLPEPERVATDVVSVPPGGPGTQPVSMSGRSRPAGASGSSPPTGSSNPAPSSLP